MSDRLVPNNGQGPEKPVESLAEIFRCYICMEKLKDAHMCPHCSKMCCLHCITRWLTETRAQCPHCRAHLQIHEIVNCRWAKEVTQQLDSLQQTQVRSSALSLLDSDSETERCTTHSREELSVYCSTCKFCICHECALWSTAHSGHSFKPLDEIYNFHCQQIKEHVTRLRRKFMEQISYIQDVEKNIEYIRTAKDQKVREIRNAVELMIARLDAHLKTKLMTLVNQKGHLTRKSEEIETFLREVESRLSSGPKSDVIKHSAKLLKAIQEAIQRSSFSLLPVIADFQSELVPPWESCEYTIEEFSRARAKADPFYSDALEFNGMCWRLKVYPDGNGVVRGTYLSVFLELTKGAPEQAKYEYRVEMIYQTANDGTKNMTREFASDFEVGECWGYNRFFRLDLLESEGFWDTRTDTVKIRFDVRPPTYYQKSKDQQWYINLLTEKRNEQGQEVKSLIERIKNLRLLRDPLLLDDLTSLPCRIRLSSLSVPSAAAPEKSSNLDQQHELEDDGESDELSDGDESEESTPRSNTEACLSSEMDIENLALEDVFPGTLVLANCRSGMPIGFDPLSWCKDTAIVNGQSKFPPAARDFQTPRNVQPHRLLPSDVVQKLPYVLNAESAPLVNANTFTNPIGNEHGGTVNICPVEQSSQNCATQESQRNIPEPVDADADVENNLLE